jgi:hypothetical protein
VVTASFCLHAPFLLRSFVEEISTSCNTSAKFRGVAEILETEEGLVTGQKLGLRWNYCWCNRWQRGRRTGFDVGLGMSLSARITVGSAAGPALGFTVTVVLLMLVDGLVDG